jgi:hypothetical protein
MEGQTLVKPHSHSVCVSYAKKFKNDKQKENEKLRGHRAEPRCGHRGGTQFHSVSLYRSHLKKFQSEKQKQKEKEKEDRRTAPHKQFPWGSAPNPLYQIIK